MLSVNVAICRSHASCPHDPLLEIRCLLKLKNTILNTKLLPNAHCILVVMFIIQAEKHCYCILLLDLCIAYCIQYLVPFCEPKTVARMSQFSPVDQTVPISVEFTHCGKKIMRSSRHKQYTCMHSIMRTIACSLICAVYARIYSTCHQLDL